MGFSHWKISWKLKKVIKLRKRRHWKQFSKKLEKLEETLFEKKSFKKHFKRHKKYIWRSIIFRPDYRDNQRWTSELQVRNFDLHQLHFSLPPFPSPHPLNLSWLGHRKQFSSSKSNSGLLVVQNIQQKNLLSPLPLGFGVATNITTLAQYSVEKWKNR